MLNSMLVFAMIATATTTAIVIMAATWAISTGISIGLSYLMRKPIQSGERDFEFNRTDTKAYLPVIYGTAVVGINRIFTDTSIKGQKLWIVGALCIGPIHRITAVYFDKELVFYWKSDWAKVKTNASSGNTSITTKNWPNKYKTDNPVVIAGVDKFIIRDNNGNTLSPNTEYTLTEGSATDFDKKGELVLTFSPALTGNISSNYRLDFTTGERKRGGKYLYAGKWANRVEIYPHKGKETGQLDEALSTAIPDKWTNTCLDTSVANIVIALSYDLDYFPNGLPNITAKVDGMKVHDPRNPAFPNDAPFWSNNNALCILDYLTRGSYPWVSATRPGDTNPLDTTHTEYLLKYGLGAHYDREIIKNTFIAEANFCDELVATSLELSKPVKCVVQDTKESITEDLTANNAGKITLSYIPIVGTLVIINDNGVFMSGDSDPEIGGYNLNGKEVTFRAQDSGRVYTCSYDYEIHQGYLNAKTQYRYKTLYVTTSGKSSPSTESKIVTTTKSNRTILVSNFTENENEVVTGIELYRTKGGVLTEYYYIATIDNKKDETFEDTVSDNGTGIGILTTSVLQKTKKNGDYLTQKIFSNNWNNTITNCVKQGDIFYFSYLNSDNITYTTDTKNLYIITAQDGTINTSLGSNSNGSGECSFYFRLAKKNKDGTYTSLPDSGSIKKYEIGTEILFFNPRDLGTAISSIVTDNTATKQKRFTCNGIVDTSKDVKNNIEELLLSCRGNLYNESGKYSLFIRKMSIPEDFELTEDNILGDWKWGALGIRETCNTIKVSWINPKKNFQTDYVFWPPKEQLLNQYLLDDNNFENQKDIDLFFTTNKQTARQIAMVMRRELRQSIPCSCTVTEAALQLKHGNLVKVTHSTPGWNQKLFWVTGIGINPNATVSISLSEYDPTVYDYDTITIDPPEGADTTLSDPLQAPDEVSDVITTTEIFEEKNIPNFRIRVTYTDSTSTFWDHSDVYILKGEPSVTNVYSYYTSIDKANTGIFYIYPVEAVTTYYIKIQSVSTLGVKQEWGDVEEHSHTITPSLPEKIKGLEGFTRGNNDNAYGRVFAVRWHPLSGTGYGDGTANIAYAQRQVTIYEGIRYYVEVAMGYPPNVGKYLAANVINGVYYVVREEIIDENRYIYDYESNIEDVNTLFEPLKNNPNIEAQNFYNTYYGVPNRTVMIQVSAIDQYSQRGASSFIILTNPYPYMKDKNGTQISPKCYPEKNAIRAEWPHPYQEYDISHFVIKIAEAYNPEDPQGSSGLSIFTSSVKWKAKTKYTRYTLVYPTIPNGHVYVVTLTGTSGTTEPVWPVPYSGNPHPTIINGTTIFQHNSVYLTSKVGSLSTVSSTDEEIGSIYYNYTFRGLDPKKNYIVQVIPYDVYGVGAPSGIQSENTMPFLTYDDIGTNITAPKQVNTPSMDLVGNNNIKVSWDYLTEDDIQRYVVDWRAGQLSTVPTLEEIEQGYYTSDNTKKCYGFVVNSEKDTRGNAKNWIMIQDAKTGFTYWARVQAENTSHIKSAWSAFGTHEFMVQGIGADELSFNFKQYYFTGTLTATDYNTCTWSAGTLKFKKSSGSGTINHSITAGNTGNMSENKWLIWKGSGQVLEAVTDNDLIDSVTYKDAVSIAYLIPNIDTKQKITIIPSQSKESTIISGSIIGADSIVANHIQTGAVKAVKIDVDSEISIGHSSGGKITIKDNMNVKRISISALNGGTPFIRISKSGYNAATTTNPNELNFDSTYNYLKIIDTGYNKCAFPDASVISAYSYAYQDIAIPIVALGGGSRGVIGLTGVAGGYIYLMPYEIPNVDIRHRELFSVMYDDSGDGQIIVRREMFNYDSSNWNPSSATQWVRWYLLAETII